MVGAGSGDDTPSLELQPNFSCCAWKHEATSTSASVTSATKHRDSSFHRHLYLQAWFETLLAFLPRIFAFEFASTMANHNLRSQANAADIYATLPGSGEAGPVVHNPTDMKQLVPLERPGKFVDCCWGLSR